MSKAFLILTWLMILIMAGLVGYLDIVQTTDTNVVQTISSITIGLGITATVSLFTAIGAFKQGN